MRIGGKIFFCAIRRFNPHVLWISLESLENCGEGANENENKKSTTLSRAIINDISKRNAIFEAFLFFFLRLFSLKQSKFV